HRRSPPDDAVLIYAWEVPMEAASNDSIRECVESVNTGDNGTAQVLWNRYFHSLVRIARKRLRGTTRSVADEEDAALWALVCFCQGAARGRYTVLDDSENLWRVLVVITERKAIDQVNRERRRKRGGRANRDMMMRPFADTDGGRCVAVADSKP